MNKLFVSILFSSTAASVCGQAYLATPAYTWHRDSVTQAEFKAIAPSPNRIVSNYKAQPGYFMPIQGEWNLKNDISGYPQLITPDKLYTAVYNMGLDEMVNAVEADTTLRTGKEWDGVWTRDVSYSILLSMAYMQPDASRISLEKKIDPHGRIIQDTGSGGAWPVSSDRQIWTVAAWEVYKVTGDKKWLRRAYEVARRSLLTDEKTIYDPATGLVRGETSFIDWREQSHPKWMQCADIYSTLTLSTSVVHQRAWVTLASMATELGKKKEAIEYMHRAEAIKEAVNKYLWMPDKGYYAMYLYGRDNQILNPRAETLGESLAIVWDIADKERAVSITEHNPVTPFGPGIFFPQIADMPPYHNNALWPWVDAWWTIANAKAGNEKGVLHGFGALIRPAALFCTNKENFVLDNGDIATELNSSNMLWCLAGNIALTHKVLFGIDFHANSLVFTPFVPEVLGSTRSLNNFRYRDAVLDITISGYGSKIKSFKVNGKEQEPIIQAAKAKGRMKVEIEMDSEPIPPLQVNTIPNAKSPITPTLRIEGNRLSWQSIEYINHYIVLRNGEPLAETRSTTYNVTEPGEYQVIGVSDDGIQSFASEPMSNRLEIKVQIPGEGTSVVSAEIPEEYRPAGTVSGFEGNGFAELDKSTKPIEVKIDIPEAGDWYLSLRYSNGNGPVNTENRCAIRTVSIDGNPVGIVVMPQRGRANWDDWGFSNSLLLPRMLPGEHTLTIDYRPENENMNINTNHFLLDRLTLTKK
ncbi:MAG: hypothetical protein NC402_01495 [Prevotella sp.]|nr:hypothetical protein [Prevotella sp.]MCM1074539.1 hypothetical protein [Ruminococcus sp.]